MRLDLRNHRRPYPPILRASLTLAAAAAAGMVATLVLAALVDRSAFVALLQFLALIFVAGPQAATFYSFTVPSPPLGFWWVLAYTSLNAVATLCVIIPLAWRGLERLRDSRLVGGAIRATERLAVEHRDALARWGTVALVVVTIAPIQGAGVLGAGVLGVMLRIPLRRLLVTLLVAGLALNAFWTLFIHRTAQAIPTGPAATWVALAIVGLIALTGVWASYRGHLRRHSLKVETVAHPNARRRRELEAYGVRQTDGLFEADLHVLMRKLDMPEWELARARRTAALLRLPVLHPHEAERLTAAGVAGMHDLASADPEVLRQALREVGNGARVPSQREVRAWQVEARQFLQDFDRLRADGARPRRHVHHA